MRPSFLTLSIIASLVTPAAFAARDPWFPDGPVQTEIAHDVVLPPKVRTAQFPLKTARTLLTDSEITLARDNLARYPAARAQADSIITAADEWASWSDENLRDLVPGAEVPRAGELCNAGCPVHGRKIYENIGGSAYPWIIDPKHPFKVTCPIGGETYPDNDYAAYYRSGFKDKSLLAGKIVDDGWGWVGPDGKRYWFVAHANLLTWQRVTHGPGAIVSGVQSLARAYVLTGKPVYAHKAAVLFRRIAEVYPNMNFEQQSDFGRLMGQEGTRYPGKITGLIWEANLVTPALAEAYDAIWETIDGDRELQTFYGQSGPELRAFMEANYLEEAIDACFNDKIRGNYGLYQRALLILAVVRQHGDNARYLDDVLHRAESHMLRAGFEYGLYNLAFRDGAPHESPGYNFNWVRIAALSADLLKKLGYDLKQMPRIKRLFDQPLENITLGKLTPALGDSGTVHAELVGNDTLVYQRGYQLYGDPRYSMFLAGLGATGDQSFRSYESLFTAAHPATLAPAEGRVFPPQPSRLFSGYGYALLNNPADTRSVGFYYGPHISHYHHDRLHFDLFAHGQAMTPDLGYPDGANEFNSGIFTWSKTTISHNTVTVDAQRQPANPAARLGLFADGPFARAISADASDTYPQTSLYRRTLLMVDTATAAPGRSTQGYVVDFFDVAGGRQHDYSLHGPLGKYTPVGGTWSAPEAGTLAGPDVAVGALYDDLVRGAKDFKGSYLQYAGSGFQHMIHVQRLTSGADTFVADYTHDKDPAARLRIRILPQADQELIKAEARVSPMKYPEMVTYLIARRIAPAGESSLSSVFASVLEPYSTTPFITSVQRTDLAQGTALTIVRSNGETDVVIHRYGNTPVSFEPANLPAIATDSAISVITFNAVNQATRVFFAGGNFLQVGERRLAAAAIEGTITALDARTGRVRLKINPGFAFPDLGSLPGRVIHLSNTLRRTPQTITAAERAGDELVLTLKDDLRVGLVRVGSIDGKKISTQTALHLAGVYRGTTVANRADEPLATVSEARDGELTLTTEPSKKISAGDDIWLIDGAVGETVRLQAVLSWQR